MPRTPIALLALLGVSLTATFLRADTRAFDMGTPESAVRDGFTRITPASLYTREVGYGWKSGEGLQAHAQQYSRQWQFSESRGTSQPPPIYTNAITCDSILSDRPNSFLVHVPPGEYLVHVIAGRSAGSARDYDWFDVSAGPERTTIKIPGPYMFERRLLRASVKEGPLRIDFEPKTEWLVAALLVFPVADQPKVQAEILGPLEQEMSFLPPDVAAEWKETKHVDERPLPAFSDADHRRGYALFARHWSEVIYPNTVPRQEELDPRLKAFASLGEYEPVTFTVFPLQDLKAARLTAGDLRSSADLIPARNLDVRCVRYQLVRPNYSSYYSYHIAPDVLEHRAATDIKQGCNQRYWITVKVPEDAKPGIYAGKLAFQAENSPAAEIELRLRVLPIKLRKNPEHIYGMYHYDPLSQVDSRNTAVANEYFQRKAELERRDMVEHGMNSHISAVTGVSRDEQGN